jgi:multiple sugar transport system permease protein
MKTVNMEDADLNRKKRKSKSVNRSSVLRQRIYTITMTSIAIVLAFVSLYPYYFSVLASFRKGLDIYSSAWKFSDLTLYAYRRIILGAAGSKSFDSAHMILFPRWLFNTAYVAIVSTFFTVLFASMGGYVLARMTFRGKNFWFGAILGVMMIPGQITLIPQYIIITRIFHWQDSFTGLIVPFLFSPFFVFMMRQFFLSFPKDLEDAAIVDGMNRTGVFFRMVLPLSKAPLLASSLLSIMGAWGNYLWPKLLIENPSKFLITQGLTYMMGPAYQVAPSIPMAGAIISMLPMLILLMIFSREFMGSIVTSGITG